MVHNSQIDIILNLLMISIENPILTSLSKITSIIFEPIILILISFAIAIYFFQKNQKTKAGLLIGTMIISGLLIKISKEIFQRTRPLNSLIPETTFAFPSGHATIAVVFLGLIAYLFSKKDSKKQIILTTIFLILFIGFTRIYLRVHWFTDIIAGFILGSVILFVSIKLFEHYRKIYKLK